MTGWVYVISNEFIPAFVKVGKTEDTPAVRIKKFESASAAPGQYAVEYALQVTDEELLESQAHAKLAQMGFEYNKELHKEWFSVTPAIAATVLNDLMKQLNGIGLIKTMGNALVETVETFEYICRDCKIRLTESEGAALSELVKRDKRSKKIDSELCSDCYKKTLSTGE